jgi:hypothetical protein
MSKLVLLHVIYYICNLNTDNMSNSKKADLFNNIDGVLADNKKEYEKLAVLIQVKNGNVYQVALNKEMCDALFADLKLYFEGGVVRVFPEKIESITLE